VGPLIVETMAAAFNTIANPTATRSAESFKNRTAPFSHGINVSVSPMPMMTAVAMARAGMLAWLASVVKRVVIAAPTAIFLSYY
jgi:hypothetical protein